MLSFPDSQAGGYIESFKASGLMMLLSISIDGIPPGTISIFFDSLYPGQFCPFCPVKGKENIKRTTGMR